VYNEGKKMKTENWAIKIEKLIVDGQKEVLDRISNVENELVEVKSDVHGLKSDVQRLDKKIDHVHISLKNEIKATAYAIKDIIDEHIKLPANLAYAG